MLRRLFTNAFGNYIVQKLCEVGDQDDVDVLGAAVLSEPIGLAEDTYGCRVVQKCVECVSANIRTQIGQVLFPHTLHCIQSQNANHVLQRCIECCSSDDGTIGREGIMRGGVVRQMFANAAASIERQMTESGQPQNFAIQPYSLQTHPMTACLDTVINMILSADVREIAIHVYGCRVLQRLYERGNIQQKELLTNTIEPLIVELSENQYGNYVIQHIMERGTQEMRSKLVLQQLKGRFFYMATHKFASNVVERCIHYGSAEERASITQEIINGRSSTISNVANTPFSLAALIVDQFGNYVAQTLIDHQPVDFRKQMLEESKSMEHALNNHNQPILRTALFAPLVADALETQQRHGQQSGASDRNKDNEASRPPSFLINQNSEQFVRTRVDKLLRALSSKTDPPTPSPLPPALGGRDWGKEQQDRGEKRDWKNSEQNLGSNQQNNERQGRERFGREREQHNRDDHDERDGQIMRSNEQHGQWRRSGQQGKGNDRDNNYRDTNYRDRNDQGGKVGQRFFDQGQQ
ncbi:MAG: hypothetical protein EZS28_026621 [Streblomastix strix]|uniref:PUM-HD domain-containing protein n=1 Tax=Streblomastix strix TaxID=222440 RepID=A0A5J4V631_9EUKA|nr:MAG: hypothetical protein EZS28_026621 [Streblomastix strix]